jgi:hypothetical protein
MNGADLAMLKFYLDDSRQPAPDVTNNATRAVLLYALDVLTHEGVAQFTFVDTDSVERAVRIESGG